MQGWSHAGDGAQQQRAHVGPQTDLAAFPGGSAARVPIPPLPAPASGRPPGVAQNQSTGGLLQNLKEEAALASARWSQPTLSSQALKAKLREHPGLPGTFLSDKGKTAPEPLTCSPMSFGCQSLLLKHRRS